MLKKKITIVFITLIAMMFTTTVFGQTKPTPKGKVIRAIKNKVAAKNAKQEAKTEKVITAMPGEVKSEATESTATTETAATTYDSSTKSQKGTRNGKILKKLTKFAMPNSKPTKTIVTPTKEESSPTGSAAKSATTSPGETSAAVLSETAKTESTEAATETSTKSETIPTEESTESSSTEKKSGINSNKRKKIRRMVKRIIANQNAKSAENPTVKKPNE
jgi:hypothetical protein